LDKNPNTNRDTKNNTTILTTILRVSTAGFSKYAIELGLFAAAKAATFLSYAKVS
jgi:hypothetical protein